MRQQIKVLFVEAKGEEGGAGFGFVAFFEGFEEVDPIGGVGGEGGALSEEVFVTGEGRGDLLEVVDLGEDVGGGGGGAGVGGAGGGGEAGEADSGLGRV
jgi:hypothetical protein